MRDKLLGLLPNDLNKLYEVFPPLFWLSLYILDILAYDPLSPNTADAQRLLSLVLSYAPLILKYGEQIAFWSFLIAFVAFFVPVKTPSLDSVLKSIIIVFAGLFLTIGALCAPFLFAFAPAPFWVLTSPSDALLKLAGLAYGVTLCILAHEKLSKYTKSTSSGSTKNTSGIK